MFTGAGGKPISCCVNASVPAHPECFPVYLDADDPYYQQFGVTCMEFVRSAPAPTCALGMQHFYIAYSKLISSFKSYKHYY